MFSIQIDNLVRDIVDIHYGNFEASKATLYDYDTQVFNGPALLFAFDLRTSYFHSVDCKDTGNELSCVEHSEARNIYIVISQHKCWCAEAHFRADAYREFDKLNWVNVSNHDACWNNALHSWIADIYFSMTSCVLDSVEDEHEVRLAPNVCQTNAFIPLCYRTFQPVTIKFSKENDKYRRKLLSMERVVVENTSRG